MDLIKALLGFVVLTGPLWLILILVPASLWIAVKISKRFKHGGIRFDGLTLAGGGQLTANRNVYRDDNGITYTLVGDDLSIAGIAHLYATVGCKEGEQCLV